VWERGGEGGVGVAEAVLKLLGGGTAKFTPPYDAKRPIRGKIETIARELYGAGAVTFAAAAERALGPRPARGLGGPAVLTGTRPESYRPLQPGGGGRRDGVYGGADCARSQDGRDRGQDHGGAGRADAQEPRGDPQGRGLRIRPGREDDRVSRRHGRFFGDER